MERPSSPAGIDIHDVYAHYGLAMYQAQCVERQLILLGPMLHGFKPTTATRADVEELWRDLEKKTLGAVISSLSKTVGLPEGFEDRLKGALKVRNWLAHNYFWERAAHFVTPSGRERMRTELDEKAAFLEELDHELTELGEKYRRSVGVSDDMVRDIAAKLAANPDLDPYAA